MQTYVCFYQKKWTLGYKFVWNTQFVGGVVFDNPIHNYGFDQSYLVIWKDGLNQ